MNKNKVLKNINPKSGTSSSSTKTHKLVPNPAWPNDVQDYFKDWDIHIEKSWANCLNHLVSDPNCMFEVSKDEVPDFCADEIPIWDNKKLLSEFDKHNETICYKIITDSITGISYSLRAHAKKESNQTMTINKLYDLVNNAITQGTAQFNTINQKLTNLDAKVTAIDTRLTNLEKKVDNIDTRLTTLETKVDDGFKAVNDRIDNLVTKNNLKE